MKYALTTLLATTAFTLCSCGHRTDSGVSRPDTISLSPCPAFQADSAMRSIVAQCQFGPRVPGSEAWQRCGEWIVAAFQAVGCEVRGQQTTVTLYDGTTAPCNNIIASLSPDKKDRILLCAHWDSRPWADNDPDEANHHSPVPAANDGASGVALMLEIARAISQFDVSLPTGLDFVCFDVEDAGCPQWAEVDSVDTGSTWCLGSSYWAAQAAQNNYRARYGILFDMVGGRGSTFSMEGISKQYAEPVVQMLWHLAAQLGYGHYFPLRDGGFITDDHVPVNRIAQIPCIDIVPYHEDGPSCFGPTWHTLADTPENIDPSVLEAVGQSVLQLIYNDN
ncbi:MAG: M28 family peptidase [Prevotellaceae bacterium]|nr:M28 family peptidase [Prevotellaceae bacterium]